MVKIELLKKEEINIEISEVLRYLGYKNNKADDDITEKINKCIKIIKHLLVCRACFEEFELKTGEDIIFANIKTSSKSLKKNLGDCKSVIVFVATIGMGVERELLKNSISSPSAAVIYQAVATAFIEKWCDILNEKFKIEKAKENKFLRPRFSPGYGDFSIEHQKEIFEILDCPRKIGVSLTKQLMMTPSKSVSAIIGVGDSDIGCSVNDCSDCEKTDCEFRRG